jgi:WD40 repeat protein
MPLRHYKLSNVERITGLCWQSLSVLSSYALTVHHDKGISVWETRADSLGSKAGIIDGTPAPDGGTNHSVTMHKGKIIAPHAPSIDWETAVMDREVTDFHSGAIHSIALSQRTSMIVTASAADESVRVRDYSMLTGPSFVSSHFGERSDEIPNCVDMHPTGNYIALAGEDEAIEFVVADTNIEAVRRIPTKIPFTLPNGAPFVNQQPVSRVKYSHTGHLLAVVTGRLAQVYHLLDLKMSPDDFSTSLSLSLSLSLSVCVFV